MRYIESTYQCSVDMREEGRAYIFGHDAHMVAEARDLVQDLVGMVAVGSEFLCEVLDIRDFGLMVKLNRAQEALLHMSELTNDLGLMRKPLSELVQVGQRLRCVVMTVEKGTGMVRVSRKRLMDPAAGADAMQDVPPQAAGSELDGARIRPIGDVPVFPIVPPRKWSKEYFRHNISGEGDMLKTQGGPEGKAPGGSTFISRKNGDAEQAGTSRGGASGGRGADASSQRATGYANNGSSRQAGSPDRGERPRSSSSSSGMRQSKDGRDMGARNERSSERPNRDRDARISRDESPQRRRNEEHRSNQPQTTTGSGISSAPRESRYHPNATSSTIDDELSTIAELLGAGPENVPRSRTPRAMGATDGAKDKPRPSRPPRVAKSVAKPALAAMTAGAGPLENKQEQKQEEPWTP